MKLWDIGSEGELYKWWNDVGKADRVYGYLAQELFVESLYN